MTAWLDRDGRLHVTGDTPITKANVCCYRGSEVPRGKEHGLDPSQVYRLLRHPDEIEKAAKSFAGLPLLREHVSHTGAFDSDLIVGSIGSKVRWIDPYLLAEDVSVWAQEAIDDIVSRRRTSLSAAYHYTPDMTPGTFAGQSYDGVMRNISASAGHVALVARSRTGRDMALTLLCHHCAGRLDHEEGNQTMGSISQIVTGKASAGGGDGRRNLRAAHARKREVLDAVESHRATIKRATELLERAERKAAKATTGIEEARVAAAQYVRNRIAQGRDDVDGDGLMRAARLSEAAALDRVESLRSALAQFRNETADKEAAIIEADVGIAVAVRELLAPRVRNALSRLREIDAEGTPLLALLKFAIESDGYRLKLPPEQMPTELDLRKKLDEPLRALGKESEDFLMRRSDMTQVYRLMDAWKAAAAELRKDPDAEIPESGK
jgi:hypothetical protein